MEHLRTLSKEQRQEVGAVINGVCRSFGDPHSHRGLGVRALGHGFYECRWGLQWRLVFAHLSGSLYFHMLGTHDDVKRFFKSQR